MTPRLQRPLPLGLALALALAFTFFGGALLPAPTYADSLPDALRQYLAQPAFQHATWGVAIHDAASGALLFESNQHRLLKPASNAKLFTGALALDTLGPHQRLATELVPTGPVSPRGILKGDLIVHGGGDFSFATRFHPEHPGQAVQSVVDALRMAGLRRVEGDLVADDSLFAGTPYGNGWTWDDLQYDYGAEVSALTLDDNVLELEFSPGPSPGLPVTLSAGPGASYFRWETRELATVAPSSPRRVRVRRDPGHRVVHCSGSLPVGSQPWKETITIPEPALYFVHRLREELIAAGIRVQGAARHEPGARQRFSMNRASVAAGVPPGATLPCLTPPITMLSPPVSSLVAAMMKPSQNLYAQLLLLQVGARAAHDDTLSTEDAGIAALHSFLDHAGIPRDEVLLDDGSGLSRSSLVTPAAIVALLRFMDRHPHRDAFLDALPIAGKDGTLRRRFVGTALEGNLQAKTGTLRYVHALSGFVIHGSGRRLVFSILLNAYGPSASEPSDPTGRAALDGLVTLLAQSPFNDSP